MESDLPWLIGAIREVLVADTGFMTACASRVSELTPSDVTKPYATIQLPTSISSLGGGGYRCMVQVDAWSPIGGHAGLEASAVVWRIATRAHSALQVSDRPYQTMSFSVRPAEVVPLPRDVSRGDANPLAHAAMRAVVTIKNT